MPNILAALLVLAHASATSIPAVDVTAADLHATLENAIANGVTDTPIRTVDAGGHHVGLALVHRGPVANVVAGTIHSEVTEVYTVLDGSGTLVTGGRLIRIRSRVRTRRADGWCRGPGWTGYRHGRRGDPSGRRGRRHHHPGGHARTISPTFQSRLLTPSCGSTRARD